MEKTCSDCGETKPVDEFHRNSKSRDGRASLCKACACERTRRWHADHPERTKGRNYRLENPDNWRTLWLRRRFSMTLAEFDALWTAQSGRCAVCDRAMLHPKNSEGRGTKSTVAHVDHDHDCCSGGTSCGRCIRGLIHDNCNRGMGLLRDDPVLLRAAAEYLERYRAAHPIMAGDTAA